MKTEKKIKLLIIEDETAFLYALNAKLSLEGYKVITATNIEEGNDRLVEEVPDIVLVDIVLSNRSSLELIEKIKNNEKFKNLPIIVFSDTNKTNDLAEAKVLGISGQIIKTKHSIEEIIKIIVEMINKYITVT